MKSSPFDVIVIGAGPAGSLTAYRLAKAGVRTALVDGSTFPRAKACGGGLQVRALPEIPFDISHLFRGELRGIRLSYGLKDSCTRAYREPLVYSLLRTEFDHYLLRQAESAGSAIYTGSPVRGLTIAEGCPVSVRLDAAELRSTCLVGADGANSIVRARLNDRQDYFWQAALSCEIPEELIDRRLLNPECMVVDWGTLRCGYAWVFPKRGYVNVGAGGPVKIARHLKRYIAEFVRTIGLLKADSIEGLNFKGHYLPTMTKRARLASKRVLLVGDAAGVVEPFTGDGISFACQSARIASEIIFRALDSGPVDLTQYGPLVNAEIGSELQWARHLLAFSATCPRLIYRLFRSNERAWETFCRTLRGEASFGRLKKDILGPFEFPWKAVDALAHLRLRTLPTSRFFAGRPHGSVFDRGPSPT